MGSLLPGWNERAPGVAPKGYEDFDENEEEMGYFASYAKAKKEQRERGSGAPILRRSSMPVGRTSDVSGIPIGRSIDRSATFAPRSLESSHSFKAPSHLQRLKSLPPSAGDRFDLLGSTPKTPKTPVSAGGSDAPFSSSLDAYKTHHEDKPLVQWWRNFDSAHLNEMPDVPVSKERGYLPQYKVAGNKINYRADGGKTAGVLLEGVDV